MDEDKSQMKAKKWSHLVKALSSTLRHRRRSKAQTLIGQSSRILCSSVSVLDPDVGDADDEDDNSLYPGSDLSGVGIQNDGHVESTETTRSNRVDYEGNDVMEVQLSSALPFALYGTNTDQSSVADPDGDDDHDGRRFEQEDDTDKDRSAVVHQTDRHRLDLCHEADNNERCLPIHRCPVNREPSEAFTSLQTSPSQQTDVFCYQGAICLQAGTNQSATRYSGLPSDRARLQSARLIILTVGVVLLACVVVGVGVDLWSTRCSNSSSSGCDLVDKLNSKVMTAMCLGATLVYTVTLAGWLLCRSGGVYGQYFDTEGIFYGLPPISMEPDLITN